MHPDHPSDSSLLSNTSRNSIHVTHTSIIGRHLQLHIHLLRRRSLNLKSRVREIIATV